MMFQFPTASIMISFSKICQYLKFKKLCLIKNNTNQNRNHNNILCFHQKLCSVGLVSPEKNADGW